MTTDAAHWKQFGSFNDPGKARGWRSPTPATPPPQLYEQFPPDNSVVGTTQPELTAWAGGANSTSGSGNEYLFQVYDATGTTKIVDSGLISTGDWTVPAGKLAWGGKNYTWAVQAYDPTTKLYSPATLYALSVQVPQPVITSGLSQNSSDHGFDAAIGNYTTSDTDARSPPSARPWTSNATTTPATRAGRARSAPAGPASSTPGPPSSTPPPARSPASSSPTPTAPRSATARTPTAPSRPAAGGSPPSSRSPAATR